MLIFTILNIKYESFYNSLRNYNILSAPTVKIPLILKDLLIKLPKTNIVLFERTEELTKINEILARKLNRNVILLGEEGTGKFSIIQKLKQLTPSKLFLELNCNSLLNESHNTTLITFLFDFLKKHSNILIYCKNLHLLFDITNTEANYLKHLFINALKLNHFQIIGTSSNHLYDKVVKNYLDLNFVFSKVYITEPSTTTLKLIMKQYIFNIRPNWLHSVTEILLDDIIRLSNKYIKTIVLSKKILLVLDSLCSIKKKYIEEKDILNSIIEYSELPSTLILKENTTLTNISNIDTNLKKCVFGQDIAITKISTSLKRAFLGLKDKNKPIGS